MLLNVMKCADLGTEVYHNFAHWANKRQRELQDIVITRTKNVVQSGIFQGMKILPWTIWGISDHASKLLGIYECELYGTVKQILGTNPDLILNIGCAEGFWGIGCARLTGIKTLLIDISEDALEVAKRNMLVNDLDNIEFSTDSSIDKLQQELKDRINPFMIMDVESNELDLLDLDKIPALNHTTIIVEAHDCQIPGITETLISRFSLSHDLEVITQGAKNPYVYVIRDLNDLDKSLLCNEGRPVTMQWIYMVPKKIAIDL
jgi:SAM-dependent methyltransferase